MRHVCGRYFVAVLCLVVILSIGSLGMAQQITLATWGGAWGKAFQESMIEPFEKTTGIKVNVLHGVSSTNLARVAAQKDNPQVDVITMVSGDGIAAWKRGLTEALSPQEISALSDMVDVALRRANGSIIFAGMWTYPMGIVYRTDKVNWKITSWSDLWDPRLKNKVAVPSPKYANAHFLVMINKLAGGTESNVDPGFKKVKELGPNLLAEYADDVTAQRLLAQAEVWVVPVLSANAFKIIEQGVPAEFVVPKEGAPAGMDVIALVKGAPNAANAKKFINYVIGVESLSKTVEILKLTPLNRKIQLSPAVAKVLTAEDMKRLIVFDEETIVQNKGAWLERWNKEISPLMAR